MKSKKYQQLKEIVANALDLPQDKRNEYLDKSCLADEGLRKEVDELLSQMVDDEFLHRHQHGLPGRRDVDDGEIAEEVLRAGAAHLPHDCADEMISPVAEFLGLRQHALAHGATHVRMPGEGA